MKTNRDYPLSSTPKPKANGELDALISKTKMKRDKAIAIDRATPFNAAVKKERQDTVERLSEDYYQLLQKKKKG